MQEQFADYNTELVGLSVDGLYSHIAWLRTIRTRSRPRYVWCRGDLPLIEDISMEVINATG